MSGRGLRRDALRMALHVPLRNPGRSVLTMLGLAIGVCAFITTVSFGLGARSSIIAQFDTLGSNVLRIKPSYGASTSPRPLDLRDVAALQRETTALADVIPYASAFVSVTFGSGKVRLPVAGTVPEYVSTRSWEPALGGVFNHSDVERSAKVCVLGQKTVFNLMGGVAPVGATVIIDRRLPCRVIGVLSARGMSISGSDLDNLLLMPLTTFSAQLGLSGGLSLIEARLGDATLLDLARAEVVRVLRRQHQLGPADPDDFQVNSPDDVTRVVDQIAAILTGLLGGIAAVSLLVGGIGIMNIQLVSVAERTHEIGIRAALGASPAQIQGQFIAEAIVLATLGSGAGGALGVGLSLVVARQLHWSYATTPAIVLGATGFGIAIGTLFGYLPARRAANLDPVEALRRE